MPNVCASSSQFADTVQEVPQLLHACVAGGAGVKTLRRLCKPSSILALQEIRSYCTNLSPTSLDNEPLGDVASLLKNTTLQHLRVEVSLQTPPYTGVVRKPRKSHELQTHMAQLEQFLSVMGPALRTVTSLDFTLTEIPVQPPQRSLTSSCSNSSNNDSGSHSDSGDHQRVTWGPTCGEAGYLSPAAGYELATLLSKACPEVSRLGVYGGLGEAEMQVFGSCLPQLTTLEVLANGSDVTLFSKKQRKPLLTTVTTMLLVDTQHCYGQFTELSQYPSLTHLELGEGHCADEWGWLLLPMNLNFLRCEKLPEKFPAKLCLPLLETLQLTDSLAGSISTTLLAALLRVAPKLQLLVNLHGIWERVVVDQCTASGLEDLQLIRQRTLSGLTLTGVVVLSRERPPLTAEQLQRPVVCGGVAYARPLSNTHNLGRAPHVYRFEDCVLWAYREDQSSHTRINFFAEVARAFPELKNLQFHGPWRTEFSDKSSVMFENLTTVFLDNSVSAAAVLLLVSRMPQLSCIHHYCKMDEGECAEFLLKLKEMWVIAGGKGVAGSSFCSSDWHLTNQRNEKIWRREEAVFL